MPRSLWVLNLLAAAVTLASGTVVLVSNLFDPTYPYRDALWFVLLYDAFYVLVLRAFWKGGDGAGRLALVKAAGAGLFIVLFPVFGVRWMAWTPGRYVYQLFDWGPEAKIGLFAFVLLGRGAWNVVNVFALYRDWWLALRARRPLFGRVLTAIPVGLTLFFVWAFLSLVRMNAETFSHEAQEIARLVDDGITCDDVLAKRGTRTEDLRRRGERAYRVTIDWSCEAVRILVVDPDGRAGTVVRPHRECCPP
jgi:hypothetical protein